MLHVEALQVSLTGPRGPALALRGVDLSLRRGETLGLIGESGCGKSMTALAVMGLLPQGALLSGSIRFADQELVGLPDDAMCRLRGRRIGMIFQDPTTNLNPSFRIGNQMIDVALHAAESDPTIGLDRSASLLNLTRLGFVGCSR